jgi:hypothetical protein
MMPKNFGLKKIILLLSLFCTTSLWAQTDSTRTFIRLKGQVREGNNQPVGNVIIINQRLKTGSFGKADGSFEITCAKTDTISLTSLGYYSRNICFKDSALKTEYHPIVFLDQRLYDLPTVQIFAPRDLEKIQDDIQKLGYNESDYMLSGINAVQSPITFLYQQFSKREKSKREAAQLWNEDKKRELLKELFHHYVDYQIIELNDEEFDLFIDFINVSDDFMKYSSQYDFLIFVRDRFKEYKNIKRPKRLETEDYNYDKD